MSEQDKQTIVEIKHRRKSVIMEYERIGQWGIDTGHDDCVKLLVFVDSQALEIERLKQTIAGLHAHIDEASAVK